MKAAIASGRWNINIVNIFDTAGQTLKSLSPMRGMESGPRWGPDCWCGRGGTSALIPSPSTLTPPRPLSSRTDGCYAG